MKISKKFADVLKEIDLLNYDNMSPSELRKYTLSLEEKIERVKEVCYRNIKYALNGTMVSSDILEILE